jgi:hypothetical protein
MVLRVGAQYWWMFNRRILDGGGSMVGRGRLRSHPRIAAALIAF